MEVSLITASSLAEVSLISASSLVEMCDFSMLLGKWAIPRSHFLPYSIVISPFLYVLRPSFLCTCHPLLSYFHTEEGSFIGAETLVLKSFFEQSIVARIKMSCPPGHNDCLFLLLAAIFLSAKHLVFT